MIKHTFVVLAYKESSFLEECLKSVLNQKYKSNVIIATTTYNKHIESLAKKYKLKVVRGEHKSIGSDFDFAKNSSSDELVTIAHQDDIYEHEYSQNIVDNYSKYRDSSILFTDYYEIKKEKKEYRNINLIIKRILLLPLRIKKLGKYKFIKRLVLAFGNSICCPAVTFVNKNCPKELFTCEFNCDVDWYAWEKLSKEKGRFIYIKKHLMGHRIDESTTTTATIKKGIRSKEDQEMFNKFWPKWISCMINKLYKNSEKNNN